MTRRRWARGLLLSAALCASAACGATESRQHNPTAPSAATGGAAAQGAAAASGIAAEHPDARFHGPAGAASELPRTPSEVGPTDVSFPPRNEPLLFRQALEVKYRDELRRSTVQTYVDQEGTVVWTQEYLRYRVNLCSHAEAVDRVFRQIDGFNIPPVCGSTASVIFPPRNEPFDFMLQLEDKYRVSLGRQPGPSYVDVEGNIVWTQEYLRYRVSGCGHADAQQRVFAQIEGRGVQPDCSGGGGGGGGGDRFINGSLEPLRGIRYEVRMLGAGRYQATLRWTDPRIDLDLFLTNTSCTDLPEGSCVLDSSEGVGVNSEHVEWTVRAGETYYLWVINFDERSSTSYTIEQFISVAGGGTLQNAEAGPAVGVRTVRAMRKFTR
jgi:hypothetical protein